MHTTAAQDHRAYTNPRPTGDMQIEPPTPRPLQPSPRDSKQRSRLEKQWKFTQVLASVSCFLVFILYTRIFWNSRHRNCHNEDPYAQAYRAGLWSCLMCNTAHVYTYVTLVASKIMNADGSLALESRQRRAVRMPMIVLAAAFVQIVAAGMNALAAYRTSRATLEPGNVPLVAIAAACLCLVASTYSILMANAIHRGFQRATESVQYGASKPTQLANTASSFLFDFTLQDFRAHSAFGQQWLLAHMLSGISLACIYLTGSSILWMTPCASGSRQQLISLTKVSQDAVMNWFIAISVALAVFPFEGGYLNFRDPQLRRYVLALPQVLLLMESSSLGIAAYGNTRPWYSSGILRVQTGLASSIFVACALYDFTLMLKPEGDATITGNEMAKGNSDAT